MLICNVSLRAPRAGLTAGVDEAAVAADIVTTGTLFAAIVDDPASVGEFLDAYLGEIMIEAASAADVVSTASTYSDTVSETMTTSDTVDAALAANLATLDGTPTNATLSNGNLTATHTNATSNSGARSTSNKNSGKYYFEVTMSLSRASFDCMGIVLSTGTYTDVVNSGTNCTVCYISAGAIYSNNASSGKSVGTIVAGDLIGVAIDLDNRKAWFRRNNGNWNNLAIGSENPATNTGGATIGAGSFAPCIGFGAGSAGDNMTANFGATSYSGTPPSGFGNWPA